MEMVDPVSSANLAKSSCVVRMEDLDKARTAREPEFSHSAAYETSFKCPIETFC